MIDRLRERLVASSKSCHNDDRIAPISERRKKIKPPEKAKRLRDRQRLSRQTKRMAKTALGLDANSDSMPQTLHMTSEPPTETFGESENNHVSSDHAVDDQLQERFEKGVEWEFRRVVERKFERDDVKDVEKNVEKDFERDIKRDIERDVERDLQRDFERDFVRDAERDAERDTERDAERDYRRDSMRDFHRDFERDADRDSGRDVQRDLERDVLWNDLLELPWIIMED